MEGLIFLFALYFALYIVYIVRLTIGFGRIAEFNPQKSDPKTKFSIVIPFRNEAKNLPALLESIKCLDYPLTHFELIMIDDFSSDSSTTEIFKWRLDNGLFHTTLIENVRISGSPKKDAISRALPIAANEWILTTDADCILPKSWLSCLNDFIIAKNVSMVAGPIKYHRLRSLAGIFQNADVLSLQGVTIGSFGIKKPFMCNGANFGYTKEFFNSLGGFSGNESVAGGDDVFLLQKAVSMFPEKVAYARSREAIVETQPARSWAELISQRVRWASKATGFQNDFGIMLSLSALFANIGLVMLFIAVVLGSADWRLLGALFLIKFTADYALMSKSNRFFNNRKLFFPLVESAIYPLFTMVVGVFAIVGRYRWKGRNFKR